MSGVFNAIGSIFSILFNGPQQPPQMMMPQLPAPTPVPPQPDRSDAAIQASADRSRRSYGIGGDRTDNSLTGGLGVPSAQTYSAVTNLLGGVGR